MKINWKYVSGIMLFVFAYDVKVAFKNHKIHAHNQKLIDELLEERNDAAALSRYYADMLNRHHVPADDFDRIAIKTLVE